MSDVSQILAKLPRTRALVIGDVMLDHYLHGQVSRISPEAPVPVVHHQNESYRLGGAANLALNLEGLGVKTSLFAPVGEDDAGAMVTRLARESLSHCRLISVAGRPTTQKTRIVDKYQQILRIDRETTENFSADVSATFCQTIEKSLSSSEPPDIILLSDYDKGLLDTELTRRIIDLSHRSSVPVFVDPKGHDFTKYKGATLLTPNIAELERATGTPCDSDNTLESLAIELRRELELSVLVITMGPRGLLMVREDTVSRYPAQTQEVFDVSGAGDTALAAIAAGTLAKIPPDSTMRFANLCAARVIQKRGTTPISTELLHPDAKQELSKIGSSHLDQNVSALLGKWRSQNKRIVFTNGCFDLLHPGHIQLLEFAKAQGDILIVGLNSDASVKRLKGSNRPLNSERDRAALLRALRCVDLVMTFAQDTPLELIRELHPNVLVKGADYLNQEIVGQAEVESWGGEVKLSPLVDGYSTSIKAAELANR